MMRCSKSNEVEVGFEGKSDVLEADKGESLPEFYRSKNLIKVEGPFKANDYIKLKGKLIYGEIILVLAAEDYGKDYADNFKYLKKEVKRWKWEYVADMWN